MAALLIFSLLNTAAYVYPSNSLDSGIRAWVGSHGSPVGIAWFSLVSTVGSVTPMIVYLSIILLAIAFLHRSMNVLAGVVAPIAAVFAYLGAKSIVLRARPSGTGNAFEGTYSFPSAHATTSSAVCCTLGYLLWREGVISRAVALVIAVLPPLFIGASRVYLDVHWTTDVLGGWTLGLAIACVASMFYERLGGPAGISTTDAR